MLAVITGASGGIGSMCAYEAARLGYDLLLCFNSSKARAEDTADMLSGFDVKIGLCGADITDAAGRERIADAAKKAGGCALLINNAGVADICAFLDTDEQKTRDMLNANLMSHIDLTRLIIPQMLRARQGAIVNISSVWGISGASCEVLYSSAKAGLIGFTKSLAKELAPSGITVNCVAPGCIKTDMLRGLDEKEMCGKIPMGRPGDALEVAKAALFLARHGYVTGQTLAVDGGMV